MQTNDEIIDIRNLTLRYGNVTLFQNFNLRVNKGQRWALVGRNGTGKTTLFSLIFADHPQAYAQEIYLFGRRRGSGESIWDIKRRINYLGPEQISYLNPKSILMKAGDYIKQVGKAVDKEVLDSLVQFFDASEMMNKQVSFFVLRGVAAFNDHDLFPVKQGIVVVRRAFSVFRWRSKGQAGAILVGAFEKGNHHDIDYTL